jgi:hypothetical protein
MHILILKTLIYTIVHKIGNQHKRTHRRTEKSNLLFTELVITAWYVMDAERCAGRRLISGCLFAWRLCTQTCNRVVLQIPAGTAWTKRLGSKNTRHSWKDRGEGGRYGQSLGRNTLRNGLLPPNRSTRYTYHMVKQKTARFFATPVTLDVVFVTKRM